MEERGCHRDDPIKTNVRNVSVALSTLAGICAFFGEIH
jgi:hypothetical protein